MNTSPETVDLHGHSNRAGSNRWLKASILLLSLLLVMGISTADAHAAAPTITSPATASVNEFQYQAIDVTATDDINSEGNGLTYSLTGGADQALVVIDASSGVVRFNFIPVAGHRIDANTNGFYEFQVTVTDSSGESASQNITVEVRRITPTARTWHIDNVRLDSGAVVAGSFRVAVNTDFPIDPEHPDPSDPDFLGFNAVYSYIDVTVTQTNGSSNHYVAVNPNSGGNSRYVSLVTQSSGDLTGTPFLALTSHTDMTNAGGIVNVQPGPQYLSYQGVCVQSNCGPAAPPYEEALAGGTLVAGPRVWSVENVQFDSGATVSGHYTYDPDIGSGSGPNIFSDPNTGEIIYNGTYYDINLQVVSPNGHTRTFVAVNPNSGGNHRYLSLVTQHNGDLAGTPFMALTPERNLTAVGGRLNVLPGPQYLSYVGVCSQSNCGPAGAPYEEALSGGSVVANYGPQTWYIEGLRFDTGETGSGSYKYDPITGLYDPRFMGLGGNYSDINVQVTQDGNTNTYIAVNPASQGNREYLNFVTQSNGDLSSTPKLALTLASNMTNVAGPIQILPGPQNLSYQGFCNNTPNCSNNTGPYDEVNTGARVTRVVAPPVITSSASVNAAENQTSVIDMTATDNLDSEGNGLIYSKSGGADQTLFNLDSTSGVITFINAPDFEAPADAGSDNVYNLQVTLTDLGGRTAVQDLVVTVTNVVEDTTPPVANATFNPVANAAGWYNADVTIDWNWTDEAGPNGAAPSGIDPGNCELTSTLAGEGPLATVGQCSDLAGNLGLQGSGSVNIDQTAPDTAITSNPPTTETTGNATFEFIGNDATSGIAGFECTLANEIFGATGPCSSPVNHTELANGSYTFSVRAIDAAGNSDPTEASYTFTVDVPLPDTTAPTANPSFSPAANAANWHNTDVTVNFNWSDPTGPNGELPSGIDPNGCNATADIADEGANVSFGGGCSDNAGNVGEHVGSVLIDKTAPDTNLISTPPLNSTSNEATFVFSGSDTLSGIGSYWCNVDTGTFAISGQCTSPYVLPDLANGTYIFSVQAIDLAGNADSSVASYTWTVNANRAPVLIPISNQSVTEGELLQIIINATDADNDSLSISMSNAPTGATLDDNGDGTATFFWTPTADQVGDHTNVMFSVQDNGTPTLSASEAITITVGNINRPPQFDLTANQATEEGEQLIFPVQAQDADNDQISLAVANEPTGASFVDNGNGSGFLIWTPTPGQTGNHNILFIATDNGAPAKADALSVMVTVGNVNRPPVLGMIGARTVNEGEAISFLITATDPEGDDLSLAMGNAPVGATLTDNGDGTANFDWMPSLEQTDSFANVLFSVTDNGSPQQVDSESVTLSIANMNRPPILNPIGNRSAQANTPFAVTLTSNDPDGNSVSFEQPAEMPTGATLVDNNDGTALFSWTPGSDQSGNFTVTFSIEDDDDANSASDMEVVTITVGNVNRAPVLAPIGDHLVEVGTTSIIVLNAIDPDGDSVTFEVPADLPANAMLTDNNDGSAIFNWTPTADQVGTAMFSVVVTDNGNPVESDSEVVMFTVGGVTDTDGDGISDSIDNCRNVVNVSQVDTDNDGYGNACDTDFNNDCVINFVDISMFAQEFLGSNALFDVNNDGAVNFLDYIVAAENFLGTPGPGLGNCEVSS